MTIGTGLGGLGGAGIGYLSSESDDPTRVKLRKALVGGATGAAIGALGGGLASGGSGKALDDALTLGETRGYAKAMHDVGNNFDMAKDVMAKMPDDMRNRLVKTFKRGWLERWLQGLRK